jgi:hypothetical protein
MLESTLNTLALSMTPDQAMASSLSMRSRRNQSDCAVRGNPLAESTFPLAMIREAFKELLATSERSGSLSCPVRRRMVRRVTTRLPSRQRSRTAQLRRRSRWACNRMDSFADKESFALGKRVVRVSLTEMKRTSP